MSKKDFATRLNQQQQYNILLSSLDSARTAYNTAIEQIDACKKKDECNKDDYPSSILRFKYSKWLLIVILFGVLSLILFLGASDTVKYHTMLIILLVILIGFGIYLRGGKYYIMLTNDIYQYE
jgi:L-asparagine transporter-like permease